MTTPNPDVAYHEAVRQLESLLGQIRDLWNEIVAGVNQAIGFIPGLREAFNALVGPWQEAVDWLWRLYTEHGDVDAVRQVATGWNEVFGTISGQAGELDRSQLAGTGNWKGTAADQYVTVVNNQRAALTDTVAITEGVSRILSEIADAQRNFIVAINAATIVFVGAVIAAWAGGVLAGVLGDIAAVAVLAAALYTLVTTYENTLDSKMNELDQKSRLGTSFPNGVWPTAVTADMTDATVKDGDASEWEVS